MYLGNIFLCVGKFSVV